MLDRTTKQYLVVAQNTNDVQRKIEIYEHYLTTDTGSRDYTTQLILVLYWMSKKQWDLALTKVNQLLLRYPNWDQALLVRAKIFHELHNLQHSLEEINAIRKYAVSELEQEIRPNVNCGNVQNLQNHQ